MSEWDGRCSGCAYIGDVREMATGPGFSRWCYDCQVAAGLDVGPRPFQGTLGDVLAAKRDELAPIFEAQPGGYPR